MQLLLSKCLGAGVSRRAKRVAGGGDILTSFFPPQLNRPASLGKQVAVASLPQQNQSLSQGTQCLAMGWGRLGTRAPTPRVLHELNVTVVTFLCREHNVCTLVPRRAAGICFVSTQLACRRQDL